MKKKIIFIFFVFALATGLLFAETSEKETYNHSLGFAYKYDDNYDSEIVGISYQQWITDSIGLQTTLDFYYDSNPGLFDTSYKFSLDAELQFKLYKYTNKKNDFSTILYTWLSCGYCSFIEKDVDYDYDNEKYVVTSEKQINALCPGLGFGLDFIFSQHISIPVSVGFLANISDTLSSNFAYSTGIRYRF